jgi:hypothetical protein
MFMVVILQGVLRREASWPMNERYGAGGSVGSGWPVLSLISNQHEFAHEKPPIVDN